MEDMEGENDRLSKEVLELQELVKSKPTIEKTPEARSKITKPSSEEINKLKTELMEKNKEIEHLNEALTQAEKNKGKIVVQRSRSLESSESALDLKVHSIFTHQKLFELTKSIQFFVETTAARRTRGRYFAFQNGRFGNGK